MAQRMMHYLFGELLSDGSGITDKSRFLLGSLLPDTYSEPAERDSAHYIARSGHSAIFDFARFREDFAEELPGDGLYLGYYMHLVEDAFYRRFIADKNFRRPATAEGISFLHNDYHILNAYIVRKYGLRFGLDASADISGEAINRIARFDMQRLFRDAQADFHESISGETAYISPAFADEFVEKYLPLAKKELAAVFSGKSTLTPEDYRYYSN